MGISNQFSNSDSFLSFLFIASRFTKSLKDYIIVLPAVAVKTYFNVIKVQSIIHGVVSPLVFQTLISFDACNFNFFDRIYQKRQLKHDLLE